MSRAARHRIRRLAARVSLTVSRVSPSHEGELWQFLVTRSQVMTRLVRPGLLAAVGLLVAVASTAVRGASREIPELGRRVETETST
jgi:hypothetical protein